MGEVILFVEDLKSAGYTVCICRICHEAEFESCKRLESPCACSGTVKFAHRDCIQRWCNEKGNTTCEICLQNFEPDYTTLPKKAKLDDEPVTIRRSVEVPRREGHVEHPGGVTVGVELGEEEEEETTTNYSECSSALDRTASCCRALALIVTVLLLMRHILALVTGGTEDYPFTLLTLLLLRSSGIVLPMFLLIRTITAIQNSIRHQYQAYIEEESSSDEGDSEEDEQLHHRIQIHS